MDCISMASTVEQKQTYLHDWDWCVDEPAGLEGFVQSLVCNKALLERTEKSVWKADDKSVALCTYTDHAGVALQIALKCNKDRPANRYFFRPSQALKEYRGFWIVKALGIPCVEVLACGDFRCLGWLKHSFFVTRFEPNTYQLLEYAKGRPRQYDHEELMVFLRIVLRQLATLHKAGYRHGGAHGRNFMCRKAADGTFEVLWLDLVAVRKFSPCHRQRELLLDLSDFIEYFELTDTDLAELQALYHSLTGYAVRFEKIPSPGRKLNRCVWDN